MSHPLLTKVLAEAWAEPFAVESFDPGLAAELIAGMPPDIADRLEQALDVCGYEMALYGIAYGDLYEPCGERAEHSRHDRGHPIYDHPYQPLVDLAADASGTAQGDI